MDASTHGTSQTMTEPLKKQRSLLAGKLALIGIVVAIVALSALGAN
jgi:hypothetical protein